MRRVRWWAALALAFLAVLQSSSAGAAMNSWTATSVARHWGLGGGNYYGVSATQSEGVPIYNQPADGCSVAFDGSAILDDRSVNFASGRRMSMGTGHQCNNSFRFWYAVAYFDANGDGSIDFVPLYLQQIYGTTTHTLAIERTGTYTWQFRVDSTVLTSAWWSYGVGGNQVEVGTISHASGASTGAQLFSNISARAQDWNWYGWSWPSSTTATSPMCGTWFYPTSWRTLQGLC